MTNENARLVHNIATELGVYEMSKNILARTHQNKNAKSIKSIKNNMKKIERHAFAEIRNILIGCAKVGHRIYYGELAQQITSIKVNANSNVLHNLLGEISVEEDDAGHGLLSVLVINKESGMPGKGFFKLAIGRGKNFNNKLVFLAKETKKVLKYYHKK